MDGQRNYLEDWRGDPCSPHLNGKKAAATGLFPFNPCQPRCDHLPVRSKREQAGLLRAGFGFPQVPVFGQSSKIKPAVSLGNVLSVLVVPVHQRENAFDGAAASRAIIVVQRSDPEKQTRRS